MSGTTTLVWFRRDLRLSDNPALTAAVADSDHVVAVYLHAPEEESPWSPGAASRWWLHHSLAALDASLRRKGVALTLRRGPALSALTALARETGASKVVWNRLYDPATVARDTAVKSGLRDLGFECESHNANLLHEPWEIRTGQGGPYRVFTPFWRACQMRLDAQPAPLPAPRRLHGPSQPVDSLALDELDLLPTIPWDAAFAQLWSPGESGAHQRLEAFCGEWLGRYDEGRNRPDLPAGSRLSPHLHFGEIGPRQCLVAARNAVIEQPEAAKSADSFVREIGWREFAYHLLHHYPQTPERPLDERFERFPWAESPALLHAWQHGRTGYPIVDAGLRELWTTGFMHNRVRMIVASLLTKNLQQPWLAGARWFWDTLVDADLAANTLGWQWTAGCGADAAPFFRIFNPVLQAERYDPARVYIRRWLPELAQLPEKWIHRPWEAPAEVLAQAGVTLGQTYPHPIVELPASRDAALAAYATIREPVAPCPRLNPRRSDCAPKRGADSRPDRSAHSRGFHLLAGRLRCHDNPEPVQPSPESAMTQAAILEGLSKSKLAVEMTEDQRRALAAVMTLRDLAQGEVIVREGDSDDHLYVVASGGIAVVKAVGTENEVTLSVLRPGDVVGELSFLDGALRYASLVAENGTRVLSLSRGDLEALLDSNPHLVYRVMRAIVRVVHGLQRRLSMQTAELTNYLYKTHGRY